MTVAKKQSRVHDVGVEGGRERLVTIALRNEQDNR